MSSESHHLDMFRDEALAEKFEIPCTPLGVSGTRRCTVCLKRVQTHTITIYAEVKRNIKMPQNGLRMHLPVAETT